MEIILILAGLALLLYLLLRGGKKKQAYTGPVPEDWKAYLQNKVDFYRHLKGEERTSFEKRVQHFLNTTRITGISIDVNIEDKLLVAASAIIPVFAFPEWEYLNLTEVLLYPDSFNDKFQSDTQDSNILGMVGSGYMEGKMILSKPALHRGFSNKKDKKNVGIHEFVHLLDKADGNIDGIPQIFLHQPFILPWLDLIRKKMDEIHALNSDINPYGGVNEEEFLSVIAEYFFERPTLLRQKHPRLYELLSDIFAVDLAGKYRKMPSPKSIGRNDPCPCGSGKKFKHCCLKTAN